VQNYNVHNLGFKKANTNSVPCKIYTHFFVHLSKNNLESPQLLGMLGGNSTNKKISLFDNIYTVHIVRTPSMVNKNSYKKIQDFTTPLEQ
jgi:hypothetical protein